MCKRRKCLMHLFLWCVLSLCMSCSSPFNPKFDQKYDQLSTGMTLNEAEKIMGPPRKRESIKVAGATMEKLTWSYRSEFYSATFAFDHLVFTEKGKD